jgi:hypothetical protein
MQKRDQTFPYIIKDVRHRLCDDGARIAESPSQFGGVWWPCDPWGDPLKDYGNSQYLNAQLNSDFAVPHGSKELVDEFKAELKAIHECLDNSPDAKKKLNWTNAGDNDGQNIIAAMNNAALELRVWDQIAFPLRRRGDLLFRIFPPRDVAGAPIVAAVPVDEFIRGSSLQSLGDRMEIGQLRRQLTRWRFATGAIAAVFLIVLIISLR